MNGQEWTKYLGEAFAAYRQETGELVAQNVDLEKLGELVAAGELGVSVDEIRETSRRAVAQALEEADNEESEPDAIQPTAKG